MEEIAAKSPPSGRRLSYKFQRLRERLRAAVRSGELSGKLPGERQLAEKFRVNAKTLSKALTDLAAEGLLERSIGRGTYVRGTNGNTDALGRWVLVVEERNNFTFLQSQLHAIHPNLEVIKDADQIRPSDLGGVKCLLDMAIGTSPELIRTCLHRGIAVVAVNKAPVVFSTHSVQVDRPMGAASLARELCLGGHRRIFVVEGERGHPSTAEYVRKIATRYDAGAVVEAGKPTDLSSAVANGFTAVVAGCRFAAEKLMAEAAARDIRVPDQISVAAVGVRHEHTPCSGYWVPIAELAAAVSGLLRHGIPHQPTTIWLVGKFEDHGTIGNRTITQKGDSTGAGLGQRSAILT